MTIGRTPIDKLDMRPKQHQEDLLDIIEYNLNRQEEHVLNMRLGIGGCQKPHTVEETARILNISHDFVIAVETKVMKMLSHRGVPDKEL